MLGRGATCGGQLFYCLVLLGLSCSMFECVCIQEVEILSLTPPLPFLVNWCPVDESSYFHPPPPFRQLLTQLKPKDFRRWTLQALLDGTSWSNFCSFRLNQAFPFCLPLPLSVGSFHPYLQPGPQSLVSSCSELRSQNHSDLVWVQVSANFFFLGAFAL